MRAERRAKQGNGKLANFDLQASVRAPLIPACSRVGETSAAREAAEGIRLVGGPWGQVSGGERVNVPAGRLRGEWRQW